MGNNEEAARLLAATLKGRDPESLEWREQEEGGWLVGPFLMANHAKFEVEEAGGKYRVARAWFRVYNQEQSYPSKSLGEADSREGAEALIRESIATDGIWALHHPDSPYAK